MRHCVTVFFLFCVNLLFAQQKHFIYIQSDNRQLFYLSVNGKMFSSTASGYAIVPKLESGIYNLTLGFADTTAPEQNFQFQVENKDLGFNLKNFGNKGWGLFNLQTLEVVMAQNGAAKTITAPVAKKEPGPISFEKKKDMLPADTTPATAAIINPIKLVVASPKVKETPEILNEGMNEGTGNEINKVAEEVDSAGVHLSYTDKSNKKPDTIRVVIPSSSTNATSVNAANIVSPEIKITSAGNENPYSCNPATEEDFRKLRKKMASANDDEQMISAALKFYKERCFTTNQLRLLSTLFLSDEARYKFFDASYQYAADAYNYSILQKEFIDPYYLNRFKAMLRP